MTQREEAVSFCLKLPGTYEDYPFHDDNWTVLRHRENKKVFACVYERQGRIWINVKCAPQWRDFWRDAFPSVVPAYHMNKTHWNSIILDGTVPEKDIRRMLEESYDLTTGAITGSAR